MNRISHYAVLKNGFKQAYDLIPGGQQTAFRIAVFESLGWSASTFYGRMRGIHPTKPFEKDALAQCFDAFGIDVFKVSA
jgi:hypothetical protein